MSSRREKKAGKEDKEREEGGKRTPTNKDKVTMKTKRKESGF